MQEYVEEMWRKYGVLTKGLWLPANKNGPQSVTKVFVLEKISSLFHKPSIHPAIKRYLTKNSSV